MANYLIVRCRQCDTQYNPYWGSGVKRDRCPGNLSIDVPCPEPVPADEEAEESSSVVSAAGELPALTEFIDSAPEPEPEPPKPKPKKAKAKAKPKKAAKGK